MNGPSSGLSAAQLRAFEENLEPGGQILCETEVTLTAQTFTAQ